ncbi:carbohydrate ABC transporter permease [Fodinisporobacter ferrooxydans]|uniref:Carbohydrate ABC transporter permease n=1 Tax=Fodinisporobacter ferrooxydans TaxID=2901836 RepID=A0ABY4CEA3_9BACL|nr:carbohydrate ABC transporter permease [Alicyclobacillaceae bacterium MYW30-H2]
MLSTAAKPVVHFKQKKIRKRSRLNPLLPLFGLLWLLFSFYPVFYMLITSLRSQAGFLLGVPWLPSAHPTFENYLTVLQNDFQKYFLNSVIVSVVTVFLIVFVSVSSAYVIVRTKTKTVRFIFNVFLVGLAIPIQAAIIPIYVLIGKLGVYNTLLGLILPSVAFGIPLTVLILVNFIRDIPNELYESMALEGITDFGMLKSLVIPLTKPALMSVAIYNFVQVWNNFLFPLVLTQTPDVRVMPLAVVSYQGEFTINVPVLLAAVVLSALPLILAYVFGRRYLLKGLTAGFSK